MNRDVSAERAMLAEIKKEDPEAYAAVVDVVKLLGARCTSVRLEDEKEVKPC